MAVQASAAPTRSLPTDDLVFTWSGGGEGNDLRDSAPFTLKGGRQVFHSFAVAVPGENAEWADAAWAVSNFDTGDTLELISPPLGESSTYMYLPAGFYYVSSITMYCTWTVSITERPPAAKSSVTLKLSGLRNGALTLGKSVTATGKVTPISLAGGKVTLTAQMKRNGKWIKAKTASATIEATGAYSWKYTPAKKGAYRVRAAITKTAERTAATTKWLGFTVE
jgi:hypothetical protein